MPRNNKISALQNPLRNADNAIANLLSQPNGQLHADLESLSFNPNPGDGCFPISFLSRPLLPQTETLTLIAVLSTAAFSAKHVTAAIYAYYCVNSLQCSTSASTTLIIPDGDSGDGKFTTADVILTLRWILQGCYPTTLSPLRQR